MESQARRRFRFKLRTLLFVVVLVCIPLGWLANEWHTRSSHLRLSGEIIRLARMGRLPEATKFAEYGSRVRHHLQSDKAVWIFAGKPLELERIYADSHDALAVTSEIDNDHAQRCRLLIYLQRSKQLWWIDDLDLDKIEGVGASVDRFLQGHPGAKQHRKEASPTRHSGAA